MYLSDKQLQNGDHTLITDVGLENSDGLVCWVNRRIISDTFGWYHKPGKNELKIGYNGTIDWDSHSWFNVVPHVVLKRRSTTPATEGILTCKDPKCDFCSSVSLEVHYSSEFWVFYFYSLQVEKIISMK